MKATPTTFVLEPSQRLARIEREKWTKPHAGQDVVYIVSDRLGQVGPFLGQKLPPLVAVINGLVDDAPWARVSVNALYDCVDRVDGRSGPYCKGRWRVTRVALDRACEAYAEARGAHEHVLARATVVADQPACYAICT